MVHKWMKMAVAVIPTYNEAESIENLLTQLQGLRNLISKIIVVDDGSKDDTEDIIKRLNKAY